MFGRFFKVKNSKVHESSSDDHVRPKSKINSNQLKTVYSKGFVISWINLSLKTSSLLFHHHTPSIEEDEDDEISDQNVIDFDQKTPNQSANRHKKLVKQNTIQLKKHHRRQFIFEHVSGTICSGQVTAILGPSGSGKSSLLKCLTGNIRSRVIGKVNLYRKSYQVMSKDINPQSKLTDYKIRIAFIPQFDCFFDCLTVNETMLFTSRLVNNFEIHKLSKQERTNFHSKEIKNILQSLDLISTSKTKIGQLSGGQRKRLSIAIEILNRPLDLLVLDEATTGLDSYASFKCVQLINRLVKEQKINAVLMVLHQPSAITFNLIDKLYIMSRTGSIIYNGLTKDLIEFLEQAHINLPIHENPADFIIEIASGTDQQLLNKLTSKFSIPIDQYMQNLDLDSLKYAHGEFESNQTLKERTQKSNYANKQFDDEEINEEFIQSNDLINSNQLSGWILFDRKNQAIKVRECGFWSAFFNLTKRYIYLLIKDRSLGRNRLLVSILVGFFVGTMYGSEIGLLDGCAITSDYIQNKLIESSNGNFTLNGDTNLFQTKSLNIVRDYNKKQNTGVIDNTSNMFFILLVIVLINLIPTLTSLSNECRVVSKEINNLNFNYLPYFISKFVVETLFTTFTNLLFISITYAISNYPLEIERFALYSAVLILFALIVQSQSLIIASIFIDSYFSTIYIGLLTVFPLLLYTGYLIKIFHMPTIFRMFSYVFPSYYTYEVMLVSIFGLKRCSKDLVTKRKLYDLKNFLRTIILKTFDDEEIDEKDDSVKSDEDGFVDSIDSVILVDSVNSVDSISSNVRLGRMSKAILFSNDKLTDSKSDQLTKNQASLSFKYIAPTKFDEITKSTIESTTKQDTKSDTKSIIKAETKEYTKSTNKSKSNSKTESTTSMNIDLIKDQSRQTNLKSSKTTSINFSNNSTKDHDDSIKNRSTHRFQFTDNLKENFKNELKNRSKDNHLNRSSKTQQSTGSQYEHFNLINLKQLINDKNLVRFLRLQSNLLNNSDGQLMIDNAKFMVDNLNDFQTNLSSSNLQSELVILNGEIENLNKFNQNLVNDLKINAITILNLNSNLSSNSNNSTNSTTAKLIKNSIKNKLNLNLERTNQIIELNESSIYDDQTEQTIDYSINDHTKCKFKNTFNPKSTNSFIVQIDKSTDKSTDQSNDRSNDDDKIIIESTNEDQDDDSINESPSITNNNESKIEIPSNTESSLTYESSMITDDQLTTTITSTIPSTVSTTIPSTKTSTIPSTVPSTISSTIPSTTTKIQQTTINKINLFRLPLNRNLNDDQIPEYPITSDTFLYLLDNFFKRIGIPNKNEEDLEDDDFDERSRVLIIYDIKDNNLRFHFQFLFLFFIIIRLISYFVYEWRIHKV